jgi:hypothetical protein
MSAPSPARPRPRKSTAKKAAPARPRVVLDLDTLDKAKAFPNLKLPTQPFTFLLDGVQYELRDPRDTDWKRALELARNPFMLMRQCLVDADEPVDNPTEDEMRNCRERFGLFPDPPEPGTPEAEHEAARYPDGFDEQPAVIDRLTTAPLPSWKLNALFGMWHEHYKIDLTSRKGVLAALLGKDDDE